MGYKIEIDNVDFVIRVRVLVQEGIYINEKRSKFSLLLLL